MKSKSLLISVLCIFVCLFAIAMITTNNEKLKETITTNANISNDNKKIGWGIKKNDNNMQPDLGSNNKKLIDENEDIAIGNTEDKVIYLTFDEGYEAGNTDKILDVLKENNVPAAFFITGHYFNTQEELIKRMIDEGHIVGNHTVNHYSMPDLEDEKLKEEIMKLHTKMHDKFGYEMKYLRPPMGEYSKRTLQITKSLGYTTVMWSFAYEDWDVNKQGRHDYAKKMIIDNFHHGEVMLLHATSSDNSEILDEVIKKAREQGYEFKSLNDFKR